MTENEMSDEQEDIVAKAEALLTNVTPGAWSFPVDPSGALYWLSADGECVLEASAEDYAAVLDFANPADAAFIAAAPDLVRGLLAEVKRLRGELGVQE